MYTSGVVPSLFIERIFEPVADVLLPKWLVQKREISIIMERKAAHQNFELKIHRDFITDRAMMR